MTLALAVLLAQSQLRFVYAPEKPVVYDVVRSFKSLDGEETTEFRETWTFTVSEMLNGGAAKLKVEKTLTGMVVDGLVLNMEPSTETCIEAHSPRGEVRDRKPSGDIEPLLELRLLRIADVSFPVEPVAPGASWTTEQPPSETGLSSAVWVWRTQRLEGDRLSGEFSFQEKAIDAPIQAEGKFVLSSREGWPFELSFKALNVHLPGDQEKVPVLYEFSMKRR